ncbi:type II toxin-antitoxin system VapC family toxin [Gordonia sp. HY002]|uniref:type II toxin-antitoxin system VapC family toxin n=1 Tax=Gordonia zhenghanii TaxID=2911516 RepID=UPI001EF0EBEF|nr:type II toxin-antitoxin system VapC family toxin [Gordonia zhenghanii]MCF8571543.1 type II toxin-antitoxin system VapC family toxin [Gordonia zhenghanii]MCF8605764.1 type II toxin-antitoxin system VapC family toxin [Gordonia zhenghanii]
MIVLDTCVISEALRPTPDPGVIAWLESLTDNVAITTITLAELLAGVRRLPDGRRKSGLEAALGSALDPYRNTRSLLTFDDEAAAEYAEVLFAREVAGLPISTPDAQIAAICRANGAVCATRNEKDFAETGVQVLNPWTT